VVMRAPVVVIGETVSDSNTGVQTSTVAQSLGLFGDRGFWGGTLFQRRIQDFPSPENPGGPSSKHLELVSGLNRQS